MQDVASLNPETAFLSQKKRPVFRWEAVEECCDPHRAARGRGPSLVWSSYKATWRTASLQMGGGQEVL